MKKVLVISHQDSIGLRLIELYTALFSNEQKELFYCTINITDCVQLDGLYHQTKSLKAHSGLKLSLLPKVVQIPKPYTSIKASSCSQINDLIGKHKINLVLIPEFIYDVQQKAQYNYIVKEIKKKKNIEIIGLYM